MEQCLRCVASDGHVQPLGRVCVCVCALSLLNHVLGYVNTTRHAHASTTLSLHPSAHRAHAHVWLLCQCHAALPQTAACPAGMFKPLEELLYDPAVPGLAWLLQAASEASAAAAAGQQVAAGACEVVHDEAAAAAAAARMAGEPMDTAAPVAAAGAGSCGSTAGLRQQLACICDVRDVDGDQYYRLNDERVGAPAPPGQAPPGQAWVLPVCRP
jgi:hypothetical protein